MIPILTYRTHNRNRSLSFINSDQLVNVNKGSRQNKPVTLGKRLALIIELIEKSSQHLVLLAEPVIYNKGFSKER